MRVRGPGAGSATESHTAVVILGAAVVPPDPARRLRPTAWASHDLEHRAHPLPSALSEEHRIASGTSARARSCRPRGHATHCTRITLSAPCPSVRGSSARAGPPRAVFLRCPTPAHPREACTLADGTTVEHGLVTGTRTQFSFLHFEMKFWYHRVSLTYQLLAKRAACRGPLEVG